MKGLLTLLTCILYQYTFGQFGIIADQDGFVNVRNAPNISATIIDTLTNGQVVFCLEEEEGEWRPIDYDLGRLNNSGYVHQSRVKLIESYDKISYTSLTDSTIVFTKDTITLLVTKSKFYPQNNKLHYHNGDASSHESTWLEKINGKEIWGTDGNIPKYQYGLLVLTLGANKIHLPMDNLFEPTLELTAVHIDEKNRTIYISAMNSDGAGGYAVLWIVENGIFKQRITTIPF